MDTKIEDLRVGDWITWGGRYSMYQVTSTNPLTLGEGLRVETGLGTNNGADWPLPFKNIDTVEVLAWEPDTGVESPWLLDTDYSEAIDPSQLQKADAGKTEGFKMTNPKDAIGARKWRKTFFIPTRVLWTVALAFLEGALKYGAFNWRVAGVQVSVYLEAAENHMAQFKEGEDIDADSGLCHIDKAIASLMILRDSMLHGNWNDDRPVKAGNLDALRAELQSQADVLFDKYPDPVPSNTAI